MMTLTLCIQENVSRILIKITDSSLYLSSFVDTCMSPKEYLKFCLLQGCQCATAQVHSCWGIKEGDNAKATKHRMLVWIVVNAVGVGPALQISSQHSAFVTSEIPCEKLTRTFWETCIFASFSRSIKLTKSLVVIFHFPRERFAFDCVPAFLLPKLASYSSFSRRIIGKGCHCPGKKKKNYTHK